MNGSHGKWKIPRHVRDADRLIGIGIEGSSIKRCSGCFMVKFLSDFYRAVKARDGRSNQCTDCYKKHKKELLKEERLYFLKTREYHERVIKRRDNKTKLRLNNGKKRKPNKVPEVRKKCYKDFLLAKYNKKITPGSCAYCGSTENIDGHHDDYTKPLSVVWLCRKHHIIHHYEKLCLETVKNDRTRKTRPNL